MHKSDKLRICDLNDYTILFSPKEGTLAELPVFLMAVYDAMTFFFNMRKVPND